MRNKRILDLLLLTGLMAIPVAHGAPLKGNIKDQSSSNPSLTVIAPAAGKGGGSTRSQDAGASMDDKTGHIVQFSAGKTYKPGEAAPKASKVLPYSALYNAGKPGMGGLNTGADNFRGNFRGAMPTGSIYGNGGSIYSGAGSIYKGAGSIYNRSAVPVFGRQTFFSSAGVSSSVSANRGVTNYAPGMDVKAVVRPTTGLSAFPRAFGAPQQGNNLFGSVRPQGTVVTRAFGNLYLPKADSATARSFKAPVMEATAQAQALPALKAEAMSRPATWDAWYNRLASAIYTRWQLADVNPGCARALITVDQNRDVDPQITDFIPVKADERDVAQETRFREAAVHAIKSVSLYEIPLFPPGSKRRKVTFEMDLKRALDGPLGVTIVKADSAAK